MKSEELTVDTRREESGVEEELTLGGDDERAVTAANGKGWRKKKGSI